MNDPTEQLPVEIDVQAVKKLLDERADFFFIDCREQSEFDEARIDGATLIPMGQIQDRLTELEPHRNRRIVVHCHHGGRSMRVTNYLREQGFSKTQNMTGGIDVWSQQIDPTVPRYR